MRINDDRKRELIFPVAPRRVVSLVPSETYNLAAIGAGEALIARTDYCELPTDLVAKLPSIGGTKNPNLEAISDLSPDLILANQEENSKKDLETLAQRGFRIYVAFPKSFGDGVAHVARLARIFRVERTPAAKALIAMGYAGMSKDPNGSAPISTFCPIWMDPLMTLNRETFMSDMITLGGGKNVFGDRERKYPLKADLGEMSAWNGDRVANRDTRYPRITKEEIVALAPELVLLPDEPHPFTEDDANMFRALDIPAAKTGNVVRTSGKDLSWYGARSIEGVERLRAIFRDARERRG